MASSSSGSAAPRVTCTEIQFLGGGQGQGQAEGQDQGREPVAVGAEQEDVDLPF